MPNEFITKNYFTNLEYQDDDVRRKEVNISNIDSEEDIVDSD